MISVVLIEPEWPSHIGAVARAMANFETKKLVIVNPKCDILDLEAIKRAKHALPILKKAKVVDFSYLQTFDYLIATTSKIGKDYNIPRSPLSLEQLSEKLSTLHQSKIAVVFGREGKGLLNKEIQLCDFTIHIPTSPSYPALNLSHSVAVVLYELFKHQKKKTSLDAITPITSKEKNKLLTLINDILKGLSFTTREKKDTQKLVWKRLISKSFLTKREAFALFGFFRKIKEK